jgi:cytochrome c oxidase subunit 2
MDNEYMKRQLRHFKRGVRGAHEDDAWGRTMAPMAMMLADAAAINNVVSYSRHAVRVSPEFNDGASLGLSAAVERYEPSASGDPTKSKALYESTCAQCHGDLGQGVWTVNAPALTGTGRLVSRLADQELPRRHSWAPRRRSLWTADGVGLQHHDG